MAAPDNTTGPGDPTRPHGHRGSGEGAHGVWVAVAAGDGLAVSARAVLSADPNLRRRGSAPRARTRALPTAIIVPGAWGRPHAQARIERLFDSSGRAVAKHLPRGNRFAQFESAPSRWLCRGAGLPGALHHDVGDGLIGARPQRGELGIPLDAADLFHLLQQRRAYDGVMRVIEVDRG